MVTYLVVLLQFQISIPTDVRSINRNITTVDEISLIDVSSEELDITTLMTTIATTAAPARSRKG